MHQNSEDGCDSIIQQLDAIASQHRIRVEKIKYFNTTWIQDEMYFSPNKKVISPNYRYATGYAERFGLEPDSITSNTNPPRYKDVDGGNVYFVTDKDGKQVILTARGKQGECELEGYENTFGDCKVITLPRADYHADLFVTPIGDNKILVANDKLMLEGLTKIEKACSSFIENNPLDESRYEVKIVERRIKDIKKSFEDCIDRYKYKGADEETIEILKQNGFKTIPVPSRIYNFEKWNNPKNTENLTHLLNYSNAITFKDRRNETVLIAAKSGIEKRIGLTNEIAQKIGIDFEKLFINAISEHIKPENVHFIRGNTAKPISDILEERKGGLHCMCIEVPDFYSGNIK